MKFFGTDFSMKYVIAEVEGNEITVSFHDSFRKGIRDVSIRIDGEEKKVQIKSTYPGFVRRMQELMLLIRVRLKHAINSIAKRNG